MLSALKVDKLLNVTIFQIAFLHFRNNEFT